MRPIKLTFLLSPKLHLTPNLIQSLHLLKLPLGTLKEYLIKNVADNPLLQPPSDENLVFKIKQLLAYPGINEKPILPADSERPPLIEKVKNNDASLQEYLLHQLKMTILNDEELAIAEEIIASLDDNGYLCLSLDELFKNTGHPLEKVETLLRIIQTLDPPGVGARNLQECLSIQLKDKGKENSLAYTIVKLYFKDLIRRNYKNISEKTKIDVEGIKKAVEDITSLNPKPGINFIQDENRPIIPDIIITKQKNKLKITLNEEGLPSLNVNPLYVKLLESPDTSEEIKQFINKSLKNALWVIKAVEQRRKNILKVTQSIVEIQKEAFSKGFSFIKPLTLNEIARISGLHHSTVGRIVSNKYASTPQGTIRLKDLFSGRHRLDNGGVISSKNIQFKILQLIHSENKEKPLTDQMISEILRKDGILISRRTIVKYRYKLKILPSHLRITLS